MHEARLLSTFKIDETASRIVILKALLDVVADEFTVEDIVCRCEANGLYVKEAVVAGNMRLFHRRGLLVDVGVKKSEARGRPAVLYAFRQGLIGPKMYKD